MIDALMLLTIAPGLHENILYDILGIWLRLQTAVGELHQPVLILIDQGLKLVNRLRPRPGWFCLFHG
jgi:hypothetical protein